MCVRACVRVRVRVCVCVCVMSELEVRWSLTRDRPMRSVQKMNGRTQTAMVGE